MHGQLNVVQLPNGAWTLPRELNRSREEAAALVEYLEALNEQANARLNEMWRVLACPHDRARPSGDDVYLVFEVIEDAEDSLWEQLRQQAIKEHPIVAEVSDKFRMSMSMSSRRYHLKKTWAMSSGSTPTSG